jgi:putative tryptophan/tyrosine transport system substrate-binding protein
VNDPVSSGVVKNMRSPEGNATGVRLAPSEGRRLQSLTEIDPDIRRAFVPFNPDDPSAAASLAQIQAAAPKIGVTLVPRPFTKDMDVIADKVVPEGVDAIFLPREGLVLSRIRDFITVSLARRLPLSTPHYEQVEMGALTGYGFMSSEIGKQAARLARQILEGKPIRELPVETARDYTFLNMETADKMGLPIPDAFLRRVNYFVYAPR